MKTPLTLWLRLLVVWGLREECDRGLRAAADRIEELEAEVARLRSRRLR